MTDPIVLFEQIGGVLQVRLNRPKQLNALSTETAHALIDGLKPIDQDPNIGCIVITGNDRAFAAGADISEMHGKTYQSMAEEDFFGVWEEFGKLRTPKIAAVNGYALGGGCELALMCDFIIAGRSAQFGLPEITLGVIPGMGGTQRLSRLVGRGLAMDLILTGRRLPAEEAQQAGLVARLVDDDQVLVEAMEAAAAIASYSKPATLLAKEAIDRSDTGTLQEGILFERRIFHGLFATDDQREGMSAFLEKRAPNFTGS